MLRYIQTSLGIGLKNAWRVLVGKPEGRRPLGRPRLRWEEDNIKMGLRNVGWDINWIDLVQDRGRWKAVVNAVMDLLVP
jgi:hypothetical protein